MAAEGTRTAAHLHREGHKLGRLLLLLLLLALLLGCCRRLALPVQVGQRGAQLQRLHGSGRAAGNKRSSWWPLPCSEEGTHAAASARCILQAAPTEQQQQPELPNPPSHSHAYF